MAGLWSAAGSGNQRSRLVQLPLEAYERIPGR
jgi:hypothetical protein